jgi:hypothetical protein
LPHAPSEERQIVDSDLFAALGDRASATIQPLVSHPLLRDAWPFAVAAGQRTQRLAMALAQMRHQVEARCGLRTLELPLSVVCDGEPFLWFVAHLLLRAGQIRAVHNEALREYRELNRLRSKTHPVPELQQRQSWCETPLWIWDSVDLRRRRLFVRQHQGQLQIWDLGQSSVPYAVGRIDDAASVATGLADQRQRGVKIRPRALVTTLYARLFLCDLFVHGIGGAKYDELTDVLIRRLFGLPPPAFLTATATVHLPIDHVRIEPDAVDRARQLLRDLRFHPERHLTREDRQRAEVAAWIQQKMQWLRAELPKGDRGSRHAAIVQANESLQTYLRPQRQLVEQRIQRASKQLRWQAILESREHAYCLFPQEMLTHTLFAGLPGGD